MRPRMHYEFTPGIGWRRVPTRYARCEDGRVRSFLFTGEADTWFSRPARVKVAGRTVAGFITCDRWAGDTDDPRVVSADGWHVTCFFTYSHRKNYALIVAQNER